MACPLYAHNLLVDPGASGCLLFSINKYYHGTLSETGRKKKDTSFGVDRKTQWHEHGPFVLANAIVNTFKGFSSPHSS